MQPAGIARRPIFLSVRARILVFNVDPKGAKLDDRGEDDCKAAARKRTYQRYEQVKSRDERGKND